MTILMDKFFIKIGFDHQEIQSSSGRGLLYIGMLFMLGMTAAFLAMIILS